jgi:hypothetical protein
MYSGRWKRLCSSRDGVHLGRDRTLGDKKFLTDSTFKLLFRCTLDELNGASNTEITFCLIILYFYDIYSTLYSNLKCGWKAAVFKLRKEHESDTGKLINISKWIRKNSWTNFWYRKLDYFRVNTTFYSCLAISEKSRKIVWQYISPWYWNIKECKRLLTSDFIFHMFVYYTQ